MRNYASLAALLAVLVTASGARATPAPPPQCGVTSLNGIGTGLGEVNPAIIDAILDPASPQPTPYLFLPLAQTVIEAIIKYETPIQFRLAVIHAHACYSVAAAFHPTALDVFGRTQVSNSRRRCASAGSVQEYQRHAQLSLLYAFGYSGTRVVPRATASIKAIFAQLGIDYSLIESPTIDITTPWGLAKTIVDEIQEHAKSDGWNYDGKLANQFNPMPYKDFAFTDADGWQYKGYTPVNDPWNLQRKSRWQPLLEQDGLGYFTHQEHVTPYIGATARLYGLDRCDIASRKAPAPKYNLEEEVQQVIETTHDMATDDRQKMLIEYFDSKFTSLLPLQITWSIINQKSLFDFWKEDAIVTTAMYHAIVLVWREKVRHDLVRPTSIVHELLKDQTVNTFAGPFAGAQDIPASDWQPYIRTMPHAEYPSGSSCVCRAFTETLQIVTGTDTIGPIPLSQAFPAGSSKTEPSVTPAASFTETFQQWSEVDNLCGVSRLWGGMHFRASVPEGGELCTGLAQPAIDSFNKLAIGDASGAVQDESDTKIHVIPFNKAKADQLC